MSEHRRSIVRWILIFILACVVIWFGVADAKMMWDLLR